MNELFIEVGEPDEKLPKFDLVDQNEFILDSKEILFKLFLECWAMHLLNLLSILDREDQIKCNKER